MSLRRKRTMAKSKKKYSQRVTENNDAMDFKEGAFTSDDPKRSPIA
jgi:hypothetical protein